MEKTEENIIKGIIAKISEVLKGEGLCESAQLVSLKALYPLDSKLDVLKSILALHGSVKLADYKMLDNAFVYDNQNSSSGEIKHTLTFLKYPDSVKYQEIDRNSISVSEGDYTFHKELDIKLGGDISTHKDEKRLEPYWKKWKESIENHFKYGESTLWSYIVIRSGNKTELIASAYLIFSKKMCEKARILINKLCQDLLIQLVGEQYFREIKQQATRSAISQYMNRNLSHNIGSHSIPQFNEKLRELEDGNNEAKRNEWIAKSIKKIQGYNEYIQGRMEFLAEFSSESFSNIYTERKFKDICSDLRKYIQVGSSENDNPLAEYEIIFRGMVDSYKGDPLPITIVTIPEEEYLTDIRSDKLGIQALYIIVENIIRNLYKHSTLAKYDNEDTIRFSIKISEENRDGWKDIKDEFYAIDIYDRHGKDNVSRDKETLNKINTLIQQSILAETNTLRKEGWGLLEMKSAAIYLSGFPIEKIDVPFQKVIRTDEGNYPYPLIASFYDNNGAIDDTAKNIGYRFYLPKVKFCLIDSQEKSTEFLKHGIEFVREKKQGGRHKFYIANNKVEGTNQRFVPLTGINVPRNNDDISSFKNNVWKEYLSSNYSCLKDKTAYFPDNNQDIYIKAPSNSIVFDHHNKVLCGKTKSIEFMREDLFDEEGNPKFFYYESFGSGSKSYVQNIDEEYKQMFYEAVVVCVSVFDERIQQDVFENDSLQTKLTKRDILEAARIYIPDKTICLKELVKEKKKVQKKTLLDKIKERMALDEYIIIHFTLIEILAGTTDPRKIEKYIADEQLNNNRSVLVFTSGRGKPSNLVGGFFYVNYSSISDCLIKHRSKLQLVTILKSLRKI